MDTYTPQRRSSPDVRDYDRTSGNDISLVCVLFDGAVRHSEQDHWVPPQHFLDQCTQIREGCSVCGSGEAISAYYSVEFALSFPLDVGVHGHSEVERGLGRDGLGESIRARTACGECLLTVSVAPIYTDVRTVMQGIVDR